MPDIASLEYLFVRCSEQKNGNASVATRTTFSAIVSAMGLLATRMEYARATNIAARLGQFMALVFVFVGLFWNPMLIFIAFLVWMGASLESGMVQFKSALAGVPMQRVMLTEFRTLAPSDPLSRAVDHTMAGFQQDFPVVEPDGRLVGVLTRFR